MSESAATAETTEDTTETITANKITKNPPANTINIMIAPLPKLSILYINQYVQRN